MGVDVSLSAGTEPGLRFAAVIGADGTVRDLTWAGIATWRPADGFLWIHMERDDPVAQAWMRERSGIDPLIVESLLAEDSRPRVQDVDDDMLIVLRGVNRATPAENVADRRTQLVPVHIWAESARCISLRDKAHALDALRDIRRSLLLGKGPRTIGSLLALIAEKIVDHLGDEIDDLEEAMSAVEDKVCEGRGDPAIRMDISTTRRGIVQLRRYLSPQRDALYRLQHDDASWLDADARYRLRDVNERLVRHIEDIDEMRSRATILNEDFTNILTERALHASNRLTALAAMVLPPSLIAGMLGANIGGVPGSGDPYAFLWFCLLIAGLIPVVWGTLKWLKWL